MKGLPPSGAQSLARAPAPRCPSCRASLRDVRPYHAERPNASLANIQCLTQCRCGGQWVVVRRLAVTPAGTRFLGQTIGPCSPELLEGIKQAAQAQRSAQEKKGTVEQPQRALPTAHEGAAASAPSPDVEQAASSSLLRKVGPFSKKRAA